MRIPAVSHKYAANPTATASVAATINNTLLGFLSTASPVAGTTDCDGIADIVGITDALAGTLVASASEFTGYWVNTADIVYVFVVSVA